MIKAEQSLIKLEEYVLADPNLILVVCDNVVNGGSLTELAKVWGIRYSDLYKWITTDESRNEMYARALEQKKEYLSSRVIDELKYAGLADISQIYDEEMNLLPIKEWPKEVRAAVSGIKKTMDGVEVKFVDKLKALNMMGVQHGMFSSKVEHSGKISLEALIASSMPKELRASTVDTIDAEVEDTEEETNSEQAESIAVSEEHTDLAF